MLTLSGAEVMSNFDAPKRLAVGHREGVFTLDDMELGPSIQTVMLGLIQQRMFWDDGKIVCRSYDTVTGEADVRTFPWERQDKFVNPFPDLPPAPKPSFFGGAAPVEKVMAALPCDECAFKSWAPDPLTGKSRPAPCQLQYVTPLLVRDTEMRTWEPASISWSKSATKPARDYIQKYATRSQPLYVAFTGIRLVRNVGSGEFVYSVPRFEAGEPVEEKYHALLSLAFRDMRGTLMRPPAPRASGGFF